MIKMQAQEECSKTPWHSDCRPLPWMGLVDGACLEEELKCRGKGKAFRRVKVLERRLDFILKAIEEVLWSPPYFM